MQAPAMERRVGWWGRPGGGNSSRKGTEGENPLGAAVWTAKAEGAGEGHGVMLWSCSWRPVTAHVFQV